MRRFADYACFDWSGQAVARPRGIALAIMRAGADAPALVAPEIGWSREAALGWLVDRAEEHADLLIGFDFSFALPFLDRGAYFPGWPDSPHCANRLWSLIDRMTADEPHLSASALPLHEAMAPHFRLRAGGETLVGGEFEPGLGRLRVTERACRAAKIGNAASGFNLIGASQVGKSSLTGMRVLHRLRGRIAVWPFDPVPESGPVAVEIYTALAARTAGFSGPTKLRSAAALDTGLAVLGSQPHAPLARYNDHCTDALLTAAWLRRSAADRALWEPAAMTEAIRQTEGWTFGVP